MYNCILIWNIEGGQCASNLDSLCSNAENNKSIREITVLRATGEPAGFKKG